MDYSIAIILPNVTACETVRQVLAEMDLQYPVYAKSGTEAVDIAFNLLPHGLRIVISQGLTLREIEHALPVPVMELPFGGLETLHIVKAAMALSKTGKIVHVGTKHLYHHIKKALHSLGASEDSIAFSELGPTTTRERVVQQLIDEGFDTFIGGNRIAEYANAHGCLGVEFDVDTLAVQVALLNAQALVRSMHNTDEQLNLQAAILRASSDSIVALDPQRRISQVNLSACEIFGESSAALVGQSFEEVMHRHSFVDIEELKQQQDPPSPTSVPVLLREVPVILDGQPRGSVISIKKFSEIQELEYRGRKDLLLKGLVAKSVFDDIHGSSAAIRQAKERAAIFAKYESPILLYGETGTGKELFAQSIHNGSSRKSQPFVAINCAALSESLIESELFGYVKGAFTGANKEGKQGLFELANKGTIFLDEISELPISIQSKLLRAIQEGEIIRVGGDKIIRVDTRVICSSNKDLMQLVRENKFKVDLYYRLCVLEVDIPPLRERPEDIPILTTRFVQSRAKKHQKDIRSIHPRVLEELSQMQFMGNTRELISIAERMVILETTPEISVETLHRCIPSVSSAPALPRSPDAPELSAGLMNFKDAPKQMILHALEQCGWNKAAAARMLKIDASTLYRKMKAYQIPSHRE